MMKKIFVEKYFFWDSDDYVQIEEAVNKLKLFGISRRPITLEVGNKDN